MDQIRENLERISELSEAELSALKDSVLSEFGEIKNREDQTPTPEVVASLTELADANDAVIAEEARRTEQAAELSAAASEAASRIEGAAETSSDQPEEASAEVDSPEEAEASSNSDTKDDKYDDDDDNADEDTAKKKKKKDAVKVSDKEFSSEDTTPESEYSVEEVAEAPAEEVAENSELSTEEPAVESQPVEAEAATEEVVEAPVAEAELSTEETPVENTNDSAELSTEDVQTESSEEPVTASNTPAEGLEFQAPADRQPTPSKVSAPVTITAGADIRSFSIGQELPGLSAVAQAILERKKGMGRTSGGDGEQHTVATFSTSYPEDRTLASNDFEGNRLKVENVTSPQAIVAAGGLTAPVETSYEIFGLGETQERPVRNSLAVFGADRGGIRFMTPPIITDLEGAASVWTIEDDIAAAADDGSGPEKPCLRVDAGEEVIVYTDAIPLCLTFGNLGARAYPELVERHTELAMVWHARFAETRLLTRLGALSTSVSAAKQLGAARDIFVQVEQAASAYRSRYRISPTATLRVIFPEWFKNALRADMTKQLPGDGNEDTFGLADAKINAWFSLRNINVTWHIDGEAGQVFGEQEAGALLNFPSNVIWYLFSEGTFLFLDGGTLDLGLVRDSTLNATNDYKLFVESWEGLAKVGVESLRISSELAIAGSTAATTDTLV